MPRPTPRRSALPRLAAPAIALTLAAAGAAALGGAAAQDRDCPDFPSQRDAQDFYRQEGGPARDAHRLDRDRDGQACEGRPDPRAPAEAMPGPGPEGRALPPNCHTGPRGGTYTIENGRKNYRGC